jgi:hypothetical protein
VLVEAVMARICVVTAGHLSTCPRMLKAADALVWAGHHVRIVSTRFVDWAVEADADVRRRRPGTWAWTQVDYGRATAQTTWRRTGVRFRAAQILARIAGIRRVPLPLVARAYSRMHPELVCAALAEPTDFFYGGSAGALAAVAEAARRAKVPYALDLEDFHSAEQDDSAATRCSHALAERIERAVLGGAAFLTAGSPAIAAAYADTYGVRPIPVHNTFPLPAQAPDLAPTMGDGLRLYWFSQTVGPRRGLEDAVQAMGRGGIPGELHLRGEVAAEYFESLIQLAAAAAPALKIVHHTPAPADSMVDLCAGYDVGLSLEQGHVRSRSLCLTNKAFVYMLGGLAVAFTSTPGQQPLAEDLAEGAVTCPPGDVAGLAAALARWAQDRVLLCRARAAAWAAAERRWHWEHPADRGALLGAVGRVVRACGR